MKLIKKILVLVGLIVSILTQVTVTFGNSYIVTNPNLNNSPPVFEYNGNRYQIVQPVSPNNIYQQQVVTEDDGNPIANFFVKLLLIIGGIVLVTFLAVWIGGYLGGCIPIVILWFIGVVAVFYFTLAS